MSLISTISVVVNGGVEALKIAQAYLLSPYVAGVRIATEKYEELATNDISEQVIIAAPLSPTDVASSGKTWQTDNVAPKPKRWHIQEYIQASLAEPTAVSAILLPTLIIQKNILRAARLSRQPIEFIPLNKEELNNVISGALLVSIESLTFTTVPETANAQPIDITLKEVPILSLLNPTNSDIAQPSGIGNPAADAQANNVGTANIVQGALSIPTGTGG